MTPPTTPAPIPDSYRRVTPCLIVRGAAKAIDFYRELFGATERMRFPGPDGSVLHAEIEIGDSVIIIEDESPYRGTTAPHLAPSPVTRLHRAVALRYVGGPAVALSEVDSLAGELADYHLFHATRAELLRDLGETERARTADERALALATNPAEQAVLRDRLAWR